MKVDPASFDEQYARDDDPWGFASRPYELDKYATTVRALSRARYRRCFEPACSIGVLTALIAERCDAVVACDGSALAIERARARLRSSLTEAAIELRVAAIPDWWPAGRFDLIVLSELGYYWDVDGWRDVIERCRHSLAADGEIVAVHWLGASDDHLLGGDEVHAELLDCLGPSGLHVEGRHGEPSMGTAFVLDRWTRVPGG